MKTTLYLILLFVLPFGGFSQIHFTSDSWSEIVEQAKAEDKAIFVDVYTKWCGPCKKMARTTFMDPELGHYMNENFINVKWDAESVDYARKSKEYSVSAYPTILFMDYQGLVHKRLTGFQDVERLSRISEEVQKFVSTDFDGISQSLLKDQDPDQFSNFLHENLGLNFTSKRLLFDTYISMLDPEVKWDVKSYDILIDNMYLPKHLEKAILELPKRNESNLETQRKIVFYNSKIKTVLMQSAKLCIAQKDLNSLEEFLKLNLDFGKKTNKITIGKLAQIENDNFRKEYYRKYRLYDEYTDLVSRIIERDILPYPPEELIKTDNRAELVIAQREKTHGKVKGPNKRLILQNHSQMFKIAFTLTGFSEDYLQFFAADEEKLKEALVFTDLALSYLDLPETRLARAKLFKLLKQRDKALSEIQIGLESALLEWRVKSKLSSLQKSLSN